MRTNITNTPAKEAGAYITKKIRECVTDDVLLLASGGSALTIIDHIDPTTVTERMTIGLVDERYTEDAKGNNFLQIAKKPLFKAILEKGGGTLNSQVKEFETFDQYFDRIKVTFEEYLHIHPNAYVIGIFGIGADGHTASIFPSNEIEFKNNYRNEQILVPVFSEEQQYPERISITPKCIEDYVTEVILYAVGENKCNTVITDMYNRNFEEYQIPALIPAAHPNSVLFTDCVNIQP